MTRRACTIVALLLVLCACGSCWINREGTFEGEVTLSGSLAREGRKIALGGPTRATIEVKAAGAEYTTTVHGCTLRLRKDGTAGVRVKRGQRCELSAGSTRGSFAVEGEGSVNRNSSLFWLNLEATSRDKALAGTLKLRFSGRRR